ncbi:hypothetical protein HZA86_03335 [Candidatus Uhrbacteria bacterium]|nr:hypothetical protein [Candidatus Uhrbacteria bacterium]
MSMRLEQRLSLKQRLGLLLTLRLHLIDALRDEKYEPMGRCPKCEFTLTNGMILHGFNQDPGDYTTGCPKCGVRFAPKLIYRTPASQTEIPFYCPMQVLAQLSNRPTFIETHQPIATLPPVELKKQYPAIYHSAITHYGSLKAAFAKVGLVYAFVERDPKKDWKEKIIPALGNMPDTVIADCAEVSVCIIRRMRRERRIDRYRAIG